MSSSEDDVGTQGDGSRFNPLAGARVLLVNSDSRCREELREVFREVGADVLDTAQGSEALELAYRSWPHVVISDAAGAGLHGIALAHHIKRDVVLADTGVILTCTSPGLLQPLREAKLSVEGCLHQGDAVGLRQLSAKLMERSHRLRRALTCDGRVGVALEGLTPRTILELASSQSWAMRVNLIDEYYQYSIRLQSDRICSVEREVRARRGQQRPPGADADTGEAALRAVLGVREGTFEIEADALGRSSPVRISFRKAIDSVVRRSRVAQRQLAVCGIFEVERLVLDLQVLGAYREVLSEGLGKHLESLIGGASPRSLVEQGVSATLLLSSVEFCLRHGAVKALEMTASAAPQSLERAGQAKEVATAPPPPVETPPSEASLPAGDAGSATQERSVASVSQRAPVVEMSKPRTAMDELETAKPGREDSDEPESATAELGQAPVSEPATDLYLPLHAAVAQEEIKREQAFGKAHSSEELSGKPEPLSESLPVVVMEAPEGAGNKPNEKRSAPSFKRDELPVRTTSDSEAGIESRNPDDDGERSKRSKRSNTDPQFSFALGSDEAAGDTEVADELDESVPHDDSIIDSGLELAEAVVGFAGESVEPPRVALGDRTKKKASDLDVLTFSSDLKPSELVIRKVESAIRYKVARGIGQLLAVLCVTSLVGGLAYLGVRWATTPDGDVPDGQSSVPQPSTPDEAAVRAAATRLKPTSKESPRRRGTELMSIEQFPIPKGVALPEGKGLLELKSFGTPAIYVDGEFAGRGSFRRVILKPGVHEVSLERASGKTQYSVNIRRSRRTLLSVPEPTPAPSTKDAAGAAQGS